MKAQTILLAATLLAATPAFAEEKTSEALPATTAPAPAPAPVARAAAPAPAEFAPTTPGTDPGASIPQVNPASAIPAGSDLPTIRGLKPDPTLDLLPAPQGERPAMNEPALIPDDRDAGDKDKSGGKVKGRSASDKAKTEAAEDDLLQLVHYRQAETKALHDPALQAIWHQAAIAHTDAERRKFLLDYLGKFYARILAIDPTVKATVDIRKTLSVARTTQRRVTPSVQPKDSRPSLTGPFTLTADQF